MRELVGVAKLVTVYHHNGVSDKLVCAVVALTRAHFCYGGRIDYFFD